MSHSPFCTCPNAHTLPQQAPIPSRPSYGRPPFVQLALDLLAALASQGNMLSSPNAVRDYLRLLLADRPHEVFCVVFLNAKHGVLAMVEMFRGTLTQTSVYPREVVIEALTHNAAAVVLAHNHPRGRTEPSAADLAITRTLKQALALVDVRVLDHFVITRQGLVSLAKRSLM